MPISPSRPRKFGDHATKNASRRPYGGSRFFLLTFSGVL